MLRARLVATLWWFCRVDVDATELHSGTVSKLDGCGLRQLAQAGVVAILTMEARGPMHGDARQAAAQCMQRCSIRHREPSNRNHLGSRSITASDREPRGISAVRSSVSST